MTTVIGGSYPAVNSDSDATINGLTVGKGGGSNAFATAIGNGALAASNSGSVLAVGYQTLASNTTGDDITAVGSYRTLYTNTTGSYLVAVGRQALQANTTASFNTAIGHKSSFSNTTGANNSSLGYHSLYSNTTGSTNVGLGQEALYSNTTASNNTAVGFQAGYSNTTGAGNTYLGRVAGYTTTTASDNTFVGFQAGYLTTGYGNTYVGTSAGYSTTSGIQNTFVGQGAGELVTSGTKNSIFGKYNGNQDGLDIRTISNRAVISDGDGNIKCYWDDIDSLYSFVTAGRSQFRTYAASNGTYANNATVDFNSMSGLIIVNNWSTGANAIWICGGGSITLISAVGGGYGTLSFTGAYRWTNTSGTTYVYSFTAIATRESA